MKKLLFLLSLTLCFSCKRDIPPTPGAITGPTTFCMGSTQNYSIAAVNGSSYYMWTVPDDAFINAGQGSTFITVVFGKHSGQITVRANNSKEASSDASTLQVTQGCNSGQWCRQTDFGGVARAWAVSFSIGNKGYFGTGMDYLYNAKKDFWEYDPIAHTWTQKADFGGTARSEAVGFSIGNKGYVGTGSINQKDFWEYNPLTNIWTQKTNYIGAGYSDAIGFSIGSYGYVGTGTTGYTMGNYSYTNDFWQYDPTDLSNGLDNNGNPMGKWNPKTPFGGDSRRYAVGFSIGNKGYIGTGEDSITGSARDFWEYNPLTNLWTQKANLVGAGRFAAIGFSIGNKGYIGTGFNSSSVAAQDFWEYDTLLNNWTRKADLVGFGRAYATGFSISNSGYIISGYDINYYSDFYQYQQ